jgi:hypothetical protein
MTAATASTHPAGPAGPGRTRHVLLRDELGGLRLRRLWPWHRVLARCAATRLDRQLAAGASPESSASLAARAIQLTSMTFRRDLATSVQRILAAAGDPPAVMPARAAAAAAPPPRLPLSRAQISQLAGPLARLAGYLAAPGPVPVQGVAMASQLLADGTSPLYHPVRGDDLHGLTEKLTRALTR